MQVVAVFGDGGRLRMRQQWALVQRHEFAGQPLQRVLLNQLRIGRADGWCQLQTIRACQQRVADVLAQVRHFGFQRGDGNGLIAVHIRVQRFQAQAFWMQSEYQPDFLQTFGQSVLPEVYACLIAAQIQMEIRLNLHLRPQLCNLMSVVTDGCQCHRCGVLPWCADVQNCCELPARRVDDRCGVAHPFV